MWKILKSLFSVSFEPEVGDGTVADLGELFDRLLKAPSGAFLIIEVPEFESACLQFTEGFNDTILVDYPLVTPEQTERESAARAAFLAVGLEPTDTGDSDGSKSLQCNMPRDAAGAAIKVARILASVFSVESASTLRFIGGNGLAIVLTRTRASESVQQ